MAKKADWEALDEAGSKLAEAERMLLVELRSLVVNNLAPCKDLFEKTLETVNKSLQQLPKHVLEGEVFADTSFELESLGEVVRRAVHDIELKFAEISLTAFFRRTAAPEYNDSPVKKKRSMEWVNTCLIDHTAVIAHPESGDPCTLYVIGSFDRKGRFVLENRQTKKRSHTSNSLFEIQPFKIKSTVRRLPLERMRDDFLPEILRTQKPKD